MPNEPCRASGDHECIYSSLLIENVMVVANPQLLSNIVSASLSMHHLLFMHRIEACTVAVPLEGDKQEN